MGFQSIFAWKALPEAAFVRLDPKGTMSIMGMPLLRAKRESVAQRSSRNIVERGHRQNAVQRNFSVHSFDFSLVRRT
jgi:hypothetical protein